jgi:hypothetical protein
MVEIRPHKEAIAKVRVRVAVKDVIQNTNGIAIVPICMVMVFVATAWTRYDLGTMLAVNADLAGLLMTLVADRIAVTT